MPSLAENEAFLEKDENGNIVYKKDDDGNYILDYYVDDEGKYVTTRPEEDGNWEQGENGYWG